MNAQSDVRFADADSSNYVAIQGPATVGTNYTLTLPNAVGNAGEALITDASGNLSWSSSVSTVVDQIIEGDTKVEAVDSGANGEIQFTTDGTRAMTIDSSQRVGIGVASPSNTLDIVKTGSGDVTTARIASTGASGVNNATLILNNGGTGNATLRFDYEGSTNRASIYVPTSAQELAFSTNGSNERVRIDSSGRLGVGTSSPSHSLHVNSGTTNSVANFESTDAGAAINITDSVGSSSIETNSAQLKIGVDPSNSVSGSNLRLQVDGSTKLLINDSGNVGINTTSPTLKLSVDGDSWFGNGSGVEIGRLFNDAGVLCLRASSNVTGLGLATNSSSTHAIRIDSSGRLGVGTSTPDRKLHVAGDWIRVDDGYGLDTSGGTEKVKLDNGYIALTTSSVERLRINSSGNLGVGVSDPGYRLDVQAADTTASLGYAMRLRENSTAGAATIQFTDSAVTVQRATITVDSSSNIRFGNSSERLRIDSSGRLLVGTTTEGQTDADNLTIADSGHCGMTIRSGATSEGAIYFSDATTGSGEYDGYIMYNQSAQYMRFGTASGERLRIDSSGRLGLGISSPSYMLDVVKDSAGGTTALRVKNGNTAANSDAKLYLDTANGSWELTALRSGGRLSFGISNSEKAAIDQNGRLLVGTTTASGPPRVDIVGNSTSSTGSGVLQLRRGSNALFDGDELGYLAFGDTISGGYQRALIAAYADGTGGTGDLPTRLSFWTTPDGSATPTERIRISADGDQNHFGESFNFRTPRTSAIQNAFTVRNNASSIATGTVIFRIWADGDAVLSGTLTQSDAKLKENIVDANSQWNDIKAVRIRNWNYKEETGLSTNTQIGVVAQELEIVSPELVKEKPDFDGSDNVLDTTTKLVDTSGLFMKSVKALQEAMERIEQLEANNAALEARVAALEAN